MGEPFFRMTYSCWYISAKSDDAPDSSAMHWSSFFNALGDGNVNLASISVFVFGISVALCIFAALVYVYAVCFLANVSF